MKKVVALYVLAAACIIGGSAILFLHDMVLAWGVLLTLWATELAAAARSHMTLVQKLKATEKAVAKASKRRAP